MGMFELKVGTPIQVYAPFGKVNGPTQVVENNTLYHDTAPWKGTMAKKTQWLEKHQVYDYVALHNGREMPMWVQANIERGYTVLCVEGVWALVKPNLLTYA